MQIHRDTASVVFHNDAVIGPDNNCYVVAVSSHRFIDAVIHNFIDKMMKALNGRVTDIHGWPFANGLEAFHDLDLLSGVLLFLL